MNEGEVKPDWRIGLSVTPKMLIHPLHGQVGIIRTIHPATSDMREQAEIELWDGEGLTLEPTDEWMTA